jgi:CDP-diacylglycerol--serine O-phosphatidyltransferase
MVSNVPFYSFKDINFRKSVPFIGGVPDCAGSGADRDQACGDAVPLFAVYGLSGYVVAAWRAAKGKKVSLIQTEMDSDDPSERR